MRFACCITNVANTPSEYVILLDCPRQQWLHERASMLCYRYTACAFRNYKCRRGIMRYEGYSKINLRLVGRNKRFVMASKRTLSSNKELLFLLYAYPHTFSPRSVGVNTDRTWTMSSPLPPAVRYVL